VKMAAISPFSGDLKRPSRRGQRLRRCRDLDKSWENRETPFWQDKGVVKRGGQNGARGANG
jgi:hypothetical protein